MNSEIPQARRLAARSVLIVACSLPSAAAIAALPSFLASAGSFASAATPAPTPSVTAVQSPSAASSPSVPTELQQLQIRQLRQQTDGWAGVRAWLPAITAFVAVIAAISGIWTYLADARKDRRLRLEDKVEENIGALVEYPSDGAAGIGKVNNALRNLQALTRVAGRRRRGALEKRVSQAIVEIVSYDLNLNDMRQARFDALALDKWDAYRQMLRDDDQLRDDIFYRYITALRELRTTFLGRCQTARIGQTGRYEFDQKIDDADLQHFGTLIASYRRHVSLADNDLERNRRISDFSAALGNQQLTDQIFGASSAARPAAEPS
jgi:hypothetical protein